MVSECLLAFVRVMKFVLLVLSVGLSKYFLNNIFRQNFSTSILQPASNCVDDLYVFIEYGSKSLLRVMNLLIWSKNFEQH